MKIGDIKKYLIAAGQFADSNSLSAVEEYATIFENGLKMISPVDSGEFRQSWKSTGVSHNSNGISVNISNSKVYASAIEFGSSPGSDPWPNPGPKTAMSSGRIYSTQAVGGTINKVFNEKSVNELANAIAKSIIRAFK